MNYSLLKLLRNKICTPIVIENLALSEVFYLLISSVRQKTLQFPQASINTDV